MSNSTSSLNRTRNYVSIGYPESLADGWKETLAATHIPAVISPLHDKDINPDGERKKAHYHILLMYEGPKTKEQAQAVFDSIGAVKCQAVNSLRGEARYLCHLDNPEKEQYPIKEVTQLSGADYQSLIELPSDLDAIIRDLTLFIDRNEVLSFSELASWCAVNQEQWFKALSQKCTLYIKEYIKSKEYTLKNKLYADTSKWEFPERGPESGK